MAELVVVAVAALAALNKGAQERKVGYNAAEDFRDARNRSMAATTAEISQREDEKEAMYSRALAVSAASGAGVDDPGLVNLFGDLNAEGDYRILANLYVGSSEAEGLRVQSETAMRAGDAALEASYADAATTVISAYGGDMGGMFKGIGSSVKGMYSNMFGHNKKAKRANMGTMDNTHYAPGGALHV